MRAAREVSHALKKIPSVVAFLFKAHVFAKLQNIILSSPPRHVSIELYTSYLSCSEKKHSLPRHGPSVVSIRFRCYARAPRSRVTYECATPP